MDKNNTGKQLEMKVANAYRQLGARKVEHDVELSGNQIDVYVELETPGHLLHLHRIAIESKDWTKPVGIDVVNGFAKIVQLLRSNQLVDEGVIISASGFSKQARKAAQTNNITLLELADLEAIVAAAKASRRAATVPLAVSSYVRSFDALIANRTQGFIGRQFLFEKVSEFVKSKDRYPSGYLLIRGDPGIGKTAFLAQLVKSYCLPVYHFNVVRESPEASIGSLCARLIQHFHLGRSQLPQGFAKNHDFLLRLLETASSRLDDPPLLIAIDALDEVEAPDILPGCPLPLPPDLPDGVYFIITARRKYDLFLPFHRVLDIDMNSKEFSSQNRSDIYKFLEGWAGRPSIERWIRDKKDELRTALGSAEKGQRWLKKAFVDLMIERSECNFMYLHHVLPALAGGWMSSFGVNELPHGLLAYYELHWQHMRTKDKQVFSRSHLNVLCTLAVSYVPVTINWIANKTDLDSEEVHETLCQWLEFLHIEPVDSKKGKEERYRIYHQAFFEFLVQKVGHMARYHEMVARKIQLNIRQHKEKRQNPKGNHDDPQHKSLL